MACALGGVQQLLYHPANKTDVNMGGCSRVKMALMSNIVRDAAVAIYPLHDED